ncbi:MAG: hypothetical protein IPL35_11295 [Sphingobacteriales bacterium]|nr:hypothetical protein [Sphingobacteriales bacterium]
MKRMFIWLLLCLVVYQTLDAQCPHSAITQTLPFSSTSVATLSSDCTDRIATTQSVFSTYGYTMDLVAGNTYVIGNCNPDGSWNLTLTLFNSAQTQVAYADGTTSGCGAGAIFTYSPAVSGTYTLGVFAPDCAAKPNSNGKIYIYNNTANPAAECPITDSLCMAEITTTYADFALGGTGTQNNPYLFCAENGLFLNSQIIEPSTYFFPIAMIPQEQ